MICLDPRRANQEDSCTGSFWEGRFKCTKIEDEAGLLACAVYIDLNPIRAGVALTPEGSDFTSIQERIQSLKQQKSERSDMKFQELEPVLWISPLEMTKDQRGFLSLSLKEYLELVDATGRMQQRGKQGVIPGNLAPILERLGIKPRKWQELTSSCEERFSCALGTSHSLAARAAKLQKAWVKGVAFARLAFR